MDRIDRIFWLDATRVTAIFGVVLLHAAAPHLSQFGTSPVEDWHVANIINAATRPSVPLFFMASGALLLQRPIGFHELKPRLTRLIVPLVAWSIIYLAARAMTNPDYSFLEGLLRAPVQPVMYHLWFLYALIGLYLCLPLVGPAIRAASADQIYYGLGLWVLASAIVPAFERVVDAQSSIELTTMAGYMGYMVLGYVLAQAPRPSRRHALAALALAVTGYAITALGTAYFTVQRGEFFSYFYLYLSPNVMLFSAGLFVVMRAFFEGRQSPFVRMLSELSFGIYLCHVAVLMVGYLVFDIRGWWIFPFAMLVFVISAVGTHVLRSIGLARFLAP